jgi:hypothetical protein
MAVETAPASRHCFAPPQLAKFIILSPAESSIDAMPFSPPPLSEYLSEPLSQMSNKFWMRESDGLNFALSREAPSSARMLIENNIKHAINNKTLGRPSFIVVDYNMPNFKKSKF